MSSHVAHAASLCAGQILQLGLPGSVCMVFQQLDVHIAKGYTPHIFEVAPCVIAVLAAAPVQFGNYGSMVFKPALLLVPYLRHQ
jgi:hypothetical protein